MTGPSRHPGRRSARGIPEGRSVQRTNPVNWRTRDRLRWGGQLGSFGRHLDDGIHAEIQIAHRIHRVRLTDLSRP
jgi:hypothetical protein